jgi:hypothetical protein
MDPLIHTIVSVGLLAFSHYLGRFLGLRKGVMVGSSETIYIMIEEGILDMEQTIAITKKLKKRFNEPKE